MRIRFAQWMKSAAMVGIVVLLVAGTARLFHTSLSAPHHHEKAVSEASSFLVDHLPDLAATCVYALPELAMQAPSVAPEKALPACARPSLRPLQGRAPPDWS